MSYLHPENYIVPERVIDPNGRDLVFAEAIVRAAVPPDGDPNGTDSMLAKHVIDMVCGNLEPATRRLLTQLTDQRRALIRALTIEENQQSPDPVLVAQLEGQIANVTAEIQALFATCPRIRNVDGSIVGLLRVRAFVQNDQSVRAAQGCQRLRRSRVKRIVKEVIREREATYVYPPDPDPIP